jgi:ATP-dependent RNA helicase DeaD
VQAVVLTPTRELAEQITLALRKFSKYRPLKIISVYGGVGIEPQIHELRTADVVIATPGRMLDHLGRRTIDLSQVKILVLDEADRMLEMGFIEDVEQIIQKCPMQRQTLLFSATISKEIADLSEKYMYQPTEIQAEQFVDPAKLSQVYYDVPDKMKFSLLVHLLKHEQAQLVMVFCNTQRNTDFVARNLQAEGIAALAIHGGFSQNKRNWTMSQFHAQRARVLVCTDVAARGLDIQGVSHVYNYDAPKESKNYIHRIGRTARAGKEGKAISLVASRDYEAFDLVLRETRINIPKEETPQFARVMIKWKERPEGHRGGSGFHRDSFRAPPFRHSRGYDRDRSNASTSRSTGYQRRSRGYERR